MCSRPLPLEHGRANTYFVRDTSDIACFFLTRTEKASFAAAELVSGPTCALQRRVQQSENCGS
eukprot:1154425-Prymnesium_polylepis.1